MTEDGVKLTGFIEEVLRFCKQVSDMLGAADRLMGESGWRPWSNTAAYERSGHIYEPNKWFPCEVFRFYATEDNLSILPFISVLLFDRYNEFYDFNEPLITAGWFDYGKGKKIGKNWYYWYARFHGYIENRKDDGTLYSVTPASDWPEDQQKYNFKFRDFHTFGLPLISIQTAEDLKTKVTDILLNHIKEKV